MQIRMETFKYHFSVVCLIFAGLLDKIADCDHSNFIYKKKLFIGGNL